MKKKKIHAKSIKTTKGQGKQYMKMTTAKRKSIAYSPKTDAEGGVESTSWGDTRNYWQPMVGGKVGAEEIDGTLKTEKDSLSETLRAAPT